MNCQICNRLNESGTCRNCHRSALQWLTQIPELQYEAGQFITPGRTGSGAVSAERSIGVNVNALDYSMANELLGILHSWESEIRSARQLTPPALLKKEPTIDAEVQVACDFQIAHLEWSLAQDWASDFFNEIKEQHSKGMTLLSALLSNPAEFLAQQMIVANSWLLMLRTFWPMLIALVVSNRGQFCD